MSDDGALARLLGVGLLSNESVSMPASGFADGVEFEETFPEPEATQPAPDERAVAPAAPHAPSARPHLSVVRDEPEPAVSAELVARDTVADDPLERRLREAEAMVKDTVERMRLAEEQRLATWARERREEEERRLAAWIDERRASVERSLDQRSSREEELAGRLEGLLVEWQARFEQRLEQRRADDERMAERRRQNDEERLRAWRRELEQALEARFAEPRQPSPAPVRAERRSPFQDAIQLAASARDVGRVMRDALADMARTSALALSIHHPQRDEVAYRYRVASEDELGALLRRETLDDGPESPAAHMDGWVRAHRAVRLSARNAVVHTTHCAVRAGDATIGVLTLQSEGDAIPDDVLARVSDLVRGAAPRLAALRDRGNYRGA